MPLDGHTIRRYQQALETRLFPPPDHLSIAPVAIGSGGVVLIDIPPQPEELMPFLVHGDFVDGRIEGSFMSIVRRRGESSIPVTAPMIHSTLAAGRALLRRGQLPDESFTGQHRTGQYAEPAEIKKVGRSASEASRRTDLGVA